jgi:hypothetical protein
MNVLRLAESFSLVLFVLLLVGCMNRPAGVNFLVGPECHPTAKMFGCQPTSPPSGCHKIALRYDQACEQMDLRK